MTTKALNQAVKRNQKRFPSDFMFPLTKEERDQLVTNCDRFRRLKHSVVLPHAFTEQGVAMLSSVLNSERAIEVNVAIMRAFVQLRRMIGSHEELARKLEELEARLAERVLLLLYALCSMLHARPKALTDRQGGLASALKNEGPCMGETPRRPEPPGPGRREERDEPGSRKNAPAL